MKTPRRSRWTVVLGLAMGLWGPACHKVDRSRPPPVDLPEHYAGPTGQAEPAAAPDRWWAELGSPPLDDLVQEVLDDNLQMHQAWARLEQAMAAHRIARAAFFPSVRVEAGANTSRQNFNFGDDFQSDIPMVPGLPSFEFPENAVISGYPLNLAASYEVDLWGRVRNANKAAIEDVAGQRDQVEAQAITLVGEVADAWFQLLEARQRKAVLKAQLQVSEDYLELVEFRYKRGLAQPSAIYQQRSQIASQRRVLPSVKLQEQLQENRLALLLGRPPAASIHPERVELPEPTPLPEVGPPADLLHRRPDVRAAFRAVLAADYRVGVAIAERFPQLSLSASTGFQGRNNGLFSNWIYTLSANLVAPLFEGGRRKAEVARTRAVLEERVAAYGQAVLRAIGEVEDALAQVHAQHEVIAQLEAERLANRASLESAQSDFLAGKVDYLSVLTAITALQAVQLEQVSARGQAIAARVRLHRALGGSWTQQLDAPDELTQGGLPADGSFRPGKGPKPKSTRRQKQSQPQPNNEPRTKSSAPASAPTPQENGP
ncbi:MAG: efflux transporter outer membrane subunit [Myxococcota bacterium]